ncbi:Metallo-dependent phosphatase-like protein [Trametes elegans]|nr:Metallo-dependent phosphatase-like protein [Trametes elegans]
MRLLHSSVALAFATVAVRACPDGSDDHDHMHTDDHPTRRGYPPRQLTPPARPLEWGDVNIIHTTDSHGWLLGHRKTSFPEPNYSGDFGDFASFVAHMKQIALEKDVDLLLVDSGDLHDGTGLSDGFPPGGLDGHESNKLILDVPYDVMAIGNHELYKYPIALDMHTNFAPKLNGRYLSSNANITVLNEAGEAVSVPVGSRVAKFTTRKGRKVTSLGVLFDFAGNDVNTTVQKVEDMVKEQWFADAIREEPDFFLLAGHMPVRNDHWPTVFDAIRDVHATTPILILGGHTHIRDCVQLDGRSMALESGRYMETVGWLNANFDQHGNAQKNITFTRRYLDPNRVTYEYHTQQRNSSFDTSGGRQITQGLNELAARFNLSSLFGTALQDYTLTQSPYPSNTSAFSLFAGQAMPYSLTRNNSRAGIPNVMITNSGSLRFDVYEGQFTRDDQLIACPFTNAFVYIPNVPLAVAAQVLPALNKEGAHERRALEERERELYARGEVEMRYLRWLEDMDRKNDGPARRGTGNATLGYVTHDDCPGVGDDILHAPLPFFAPPDFIGSDPPTLPDDTLVDLVFTEFITTQMLETINGLQSDRAYVDADVLPYSDVLSNAMLGPYAEKYWN